MQALDILESGSYYHIYNRGINSCDLFIEEDNYAYFLNLYEKYIDPIADTYAWVLMPNHFHVLLRLKDVEEIDSTELKATHQYFSNLFNAYTKAFNKRNNRHGALFERPFKRKLIENDTYLNRVLLYIHNNPVHHDFCSHAIEYGWSSYLSCLSNRPTKLKRKEVIEWFNDEANFKYMHQHAMASKQMEEWLGLE
ncbi:transposase [Ancylomarina longa]|uniref:Transposase IS200-like domain-containing protein n=1 Tax=Ancylomarina longa TaxID=2487017 RepID=A0A434AW96_9BACT|nr:transposase [Ancylomarina longa]RUT78779.1 hypothetical protein DLK05_06485 [Ancylomarina longa]